MGYITAIYFSLPPAKGKLQRELNLILYIHTLNHGQAVNGPPAAASLWEDGCLVLVVRWTLQMAISQEF